MNINNGLSLYHIPEQYRNKNIIKLAIKNNGGCLPAVPYKFVDKKLILEAIYSNPRIYNTLNNEYKNDSDIVELAFALYPANFKYFSEEYQEKYKLKYRKRTF